MRSAMGAKLQLYSIRLPCTRMVLVPAPCTQPPQRFRNAARSLISGSRAAPRRTVSPCAAAAARSRVSVAPTLGNPSVMSAPCSPAGAVRISLAPYSRQCKPICARPERFRSTGLAPMRQHRFHPAKPRQKRCAEQNGCPHPRGGFRRKAAGGRHALHRDVAALPAGRAARTLQKLHAGVHIRKMRHLQKTHRAIAQKGRCQQRQHAVFGCRDVYCAVQRHAACDDKISAHAKSPRSAKDTSCYAARRLFVYFVCSCVICLSGYL